ncbi:MAG: GAF domain-containing protein [Chloroflexi bacterium]|nr:GAF domain-containing protein [Chloroflexota bacterium]
MISPLQNPAYLLPPLLAALLSVLLGALVGWRARWSTQHRYFALFLLGNGLWSLLTYFMRTSPDTQQAVLWERALVPVALIISPAFYFFTVSYTRGEVFRGARPVALAFIVAVAALASAGLLIDRMEVKSYGYTPIFHLPFYPMVLMAYLWIGLGLASLYRGYRAAKVYEERNRLLYILVASFFPLAGTIADLFPSAYPASILGNLTFGALTMVAMRRYHLLDVSLALRKGSAYLLVSTLVALPYVAIIIIVTEVSRGISAQPVVLFVLMVVLALGLQPLWGLGQQVVDQVFFRRRWDLVRTLEELTRRSRSVADLERSAYNLLDVIPSVVPTEGFALLLPSDGEEFVSVVASGASLAGLHLSQNSPLARWLAKHRRPLEHYYLDMDPLLLAMADREKQLLVASRAHLFVPMVLREQLTGILVLGPKRAEAPYSVDEMRLLTMTSAQAAVLLDDARLYRTISSQFDRERRRLEAFEAAARRLALAEDPKQALQGLVDTARSLLDARYVVLSLRQYEGAQEEWIASGRVTAQQNGGGPSGDGHGDGDRVPPPDASLNVPIKGRGGSVGALYAVEHSGAVAFSEDDQRVLVLFAVLAEVLFENIRLYSAVEHERGMLAAIQASMAEGLVVLGPSERVIYLNPAARDLLGLAGGEDVRVDLRELLLTAPLEDNSRAALEGFVRAVKDAAGTVGTAEVQVSGPQPRELALTAFPIPTATRERMLGLLLRDVTHEREMERRRDMFVSVASHELRTPLASLVGFSELLLTRRLPGTSQKDFLTRIHRESLRLAGLVDDLLNVSRIQSGKIAVQLETVDLRPLVEETVEKQRYLSTRHRLVAQVPPDIPKVRADQDKLVQVVANLLSNAIKYSPQGGEVKVVVSHEPELKRVVVGVSDQGIGISEEDQAELFSKFHRILRPETVGIRGSGLGLYIVKGLVELMEGTVWMRSRVGEGSTFYFSIPTAECPSDKGESGALRPEVGRP